MRNVKSALAVIILLAIAARVVWWAIEPALPAILIAALLIMIWGMVFRRRW